jgi:hypothetical protein
MGSEEMIHRRASRDQRGKDVVFLCPLPYHCARFLGLPKQAQTDSMSAECQTWEHIENKGRQEAIFPYQTWEHTENKAVS